MQSSWKILCSSLQVPASAKAEARAREDAYSKFRSLRDKLAGLQLQRLCGRFWQLNEGITYALRQLALISEYYKQSCQQFCVPLFHFPLLQLLQGVCRSLLWWIWRCRIWFSLWYSVSFIIRMLCFHQFTTRIYRAKKEEGDEVTEIDITYMFVPPSTQ